MPYDMRKDALDCSYQGVRRLLYAVAKSLAKEYGCRLEELVSDANLIWLEGHYKWTPKTKCSYVTYCWRRIEWGLLDSLRRRIKTDHREIQTEDLESFPDKIEATDNWMDELSEDALLICSVILDAPAELAELLNTEGWRTSLDRRKVLGWIRRYFKTQGWDQDRVETAYAEIRGVL